MSDPLVSVVIPTYNSPEVKRAVQSVLDQTYQNLEVIVVDDHSDVPAENHVDEISDERLSVIRHKENQFVSSARNTGIENSEGEYLAFLDDDDIWAEDKVEKQLQQIRETGYEACYTGYSRIHEDGREEVIYSLEGNFKEKIIKREASIGPGSTLLVARSAIEKSGKFDEDLDFAEDAEFILRLMEPTGFCVVQEPLITIEAEEDGRSVEVFTKGKLNYLEKIRPRMEGLGYLTRRRVFALHYLHISWFCSQKGDRRSGLKYLGKAVLEYPVPKIYDLARAGYNLLKGERT